MRDDDASTETPVTADENGVARTESGASFYADMSKLPRVSLVLLSAFLASACVQNLAPVVVPSPEAAVPAAGGGPAANDGAPDAANPAGAPTASPASRPATVGPSAPLSAAEAALASHDLMLPVAGVSPDQLQDSFDAPRSGGRLHHAIDIMAPRGTPVLSADDGRVLRVSSNPLGGLTVFTVDPSGQFVYYYAHLEGYKRGLTAGAPVFKGDTLGFVGTTGDAPDNLPHLHFQILRMPRDGKYWEGEPIDPFPLLSGRGTRIVGTH